MSARSYSSSQSGAKRKCLPSCTDNIESWASSEIEQETFAFLWTLKNYSAFSSSEEIKSPCFRGGPKSNHYWQLKMNPRKKSDDLDFFSIHLILTGFGEGENSSSRKIKVRFQISLLDSDGRPGKQAGSSSMNVCEFKKCSVWGYDKFILSNDLTSPTRRLVEDDQLKIHCRVWIEGELKHKTGTHDKFMSLTETERTLKRKQLLSDNLKTLLDNPTYADAALVVGTNTFMAHKAILASRSTVFDAMFSSKMRESEINSVEISDFDEDIVKCMLEYMYTGETEGLSVKAPDLMQIAEKYDIPGLKEDCENSIAQALTIENASEVLVMAHMYNANLLKPKVIDFINRNKEEVKKTKSFQKIAQANQAVFVELYLSQ